MYNNDLPKRAELPSSKQLLVSTGAALTLAAALLITTILPAEYGIDPTGAGRLLGLTQMGEIKVALAEEAAKDAAVPAAVALAPTPSVATAQPKLADTAPKEAPVNALADAAAVAEVADVAKAATPQSSPATAAEDKTASASRAAQASESVGQAHQRVFKLKPGAAAEIKLVMQKGAKVLYRWSTEGGNLNYDTHGDNATTSYYGYDKGRNVDGGEGELVAAFDGSHGWFWRNRSSREVTVTLNTEGDYESIKRVL